MGGGMPDIKELKSRTTTRATQSMDEIMNRHGLHELMNPHGIVARECLASDTNPHPLPILFALDTTGSMGVLPRRLVKNDLIHVLERLTLMGAAKHFQPQICFSGIADTQDTAPCQIGQFEADNRMDDWLTKIYLDGGSGSAAMHEAYYLTLYALARKTKCDIWQQGGKGIALIAGDEKCPRVVPRQVIAQVFGDKLDRDLKVQDLIAEVREKWHLYFLYVATEAYGRENVEPIWRSWQELLGDHAIRLDTQATAVPEIVASLVGISVGAFEAVDVPKDLRELGCDAAVITAVARALNVPDGLPSDEPERASKRQRRGPAPA